MALTTSWIETLRTGIYQRCSVLELNPLTIGMLPAFNLTENAGTGILLKSAIPQGIESAIKTLAPYFINHVLWTGENEPDMEADYEPAGWVMWTAKSLWNEAYDGYFVPHEQSGVMSDKQLDRNWYDAMRTALNLLLYVPYTSTRVGLGQTGGGGISESYSRAGGLLEAERLPRTPVAVWEGTLGEQTENTTINVTVWGIKYSNSHNDATGYQHAFAMETGAWTGSEPPIIYTDSDWNYNWLAGKNVVKYDEPTIPVKSISSTINRWHKIEKNDGYTPPGYHLEKPLDLSDVSIVEGWAKQDEQTVAADTATEYEELIDTELNELDPPEPSEVNTDLNEGGGNWWGFWYAQFMCGANEYDPRATSAKTYSSIDFPYFAAYRKYEFTQLTPPLV